MLLGFATVLTTLSKAIQVILAAPVQLPVKVVKVVKYIAIGLGVLEAVIPNEHEEQPKTTEEQEGGDEASAQ